MKRAPITEGMMISVLGTLELPPVPGFPPPVLSAGLLDRLAVKFPEQISLVLDGLIHSRDVSATTHKYIVVPVLQPKAEFDELTVAPVQKEESQHGTASPAGWRLV